MALSNLPRGRCCGCKNYFLGMILCLHCSIHHTYLTPQREKANLQHTPNGFQRHQQVPPFPVSLPRALFHFSKPCHYRGNVPVKKVVCVVFDEAHKATGLHYFLFSPLVLFLSLLYVTICLFRRACVLYNDERSPCSKQQVLKSRKPTQSSHSSKL